MATRSGNLDRPAQSWSPWSGAITASDGARIVIERKGAGNPFASWLGYLRRPGKSDDLVRRMRGPR